MRPQVSGLRVQYLRAEDGVLICGADDVLDSLRSLFPSYPSVPLSPCSLSLLLQHLQIQRLDQHAIHGADRGEGALQRGGLAGLDSDHKGQRVGGIAGLLHDGADVDLLVGKRRGDGGHDARPVFDQEADVMGNLELGAHAGRGGGNLDAARAVGEGEQIADHGDRRRLAAGAVAGEDHIAAVVAGGDDHILRSLRPGQRRTQRNQHGANSGREPALDLLGARNLADGAAEVAGIAEVDGRDGGDGPGNDFLGIDLDAEDEAHEDGKLGARVESAHVFSGIGFGIAPGLSLGQHLCKLGALLHLAEDEIAGAVENALDALDAVAGHALFEAGNDGDSAGDCGAVLEMAAFGRGQPLQFDAVIGDELFVGGDHAFARFERAAHPGAGGIEATGKLHNHVDIGSKHGIGVFAPNDACGSPVDALARYAAIENVGQLEALRL